MKELTPLRKGFLDTIKTNKGVTIGEVNKRHKVLILFLRQSQCCFCREAIAAMAENYMTLLELNTVPVLVHMESPKIFAEALEEFAKDDPVTSSFITAFDDNNIISNEFQIQRSLGDFIKHFFPTLKAFLNSDQDASPIPKENVDLFRVPSFFVIENDVVINEYRNVHMGSRPDYVQLLMDPDYEVNDEPTPINLDEVCEGVYCSLDLKKNKPNLIDIIKKDSNARKSISCMPREQTLDETIEESDEIDMITTLSNKKYIKHFHVYCAKEHAGENVSFWKEVNYKFKKEDDEEKRKKIAKKIFDTYLNPDSLFELNVTDKLKSSTRQSFDNECGIELFDNLVIDVENQMLNHLFLRFKQSPSFVDMVVKNKK